MARSFLVGSVTLVLLCLTGESIGELVRKNDPGIVGNELPSDDDSNLTYDSETGLEWLDITLSTDRSYREISQEFGVGGDYDGFRFATGADLTTLFGNAGLILEDQRLPAVQQILDFFDLFGAEDPPPPWKDGLLSAGRFDDQNGDPDLVGLAFVSEVPVGADGDKALVRIRTDNTAFGRKDMKELFAGAWLVRPALNVLDCNGDGGVNILDADCATSETIAATLNSAGLLRGDADGNGQVEFADFLVLSAHFAGEGAYTQGDFDKDGLVQFSDFLILSQNFGQQGTVAASVPEPSGVLLLLFSTFLLRIRSIVGGGETVRGRS